MSGLDLYRTQSELLWMLAWAFVTGVGLGILYDLLRAFRILAGIRREQGRTLLFRTVLFFEDLLWAVATFVSLILLCYYTNDGLLRAPAVLGMASGFSVYVGTLGRLTVKAENALSRLLKRVFQAVFSLLRRPLMRVALVVKKISHSLWRALFGKAIDKRRERRQRRQAEKQTHPPTEPLPPKGTTVFSTRGPT